MSFTAEVYPSEFNALSQKMDGEVHHDRMHRMLFAQDASVYQEEPLGVAYPRHTADVQALVRFAERMNISLIPRGAGTSLAGQCVGPGLVVDLGRHMNQILELNVEEGWVRVQPGVILDDLNRYLAPHGLFFGPDTSTSNRCMIGGMIGNNSCGSHSIYFGQTRAHLLEMGVVFSDGNFESIAPWSEAELAEKLDDTGRFGKGLRALDKAVRNNGELIRQHYPRPEVRRRNTGYPLDVVESSKPYITQSLMGGSSRAFSLAEFLCGTEGTLAITTEATLNLVPRPSHNILICVHFETVRAALEATILAVEHTPAAVELVDRPILELTKHNLEQQRHRFFVEGDPEAILVVEFYADNDAELERKAAELIEAFKSRGFGYSYPIVHAPKDKSVWALRKAGLGLLMGTPGDTKPVTVVEDTAVAVDVLPDYIDDFRAIMERHGNECVYYAHASVGELHLRPQLNLKDAADAKKFEEIAGDVADLVRKYGGAISGEHGDGRLRAPLLERFYGAEIMALHKQVKDAFDPKNILNPKKIVDPEPMVQDWRATPGEPTPEVETYYSWADDHGLVRAVEKCNGAGVCRKRAEAGGTMCPSYMATLDEKDSTRGRANVFRQALYSPNPADAFKSEELHDALDLCLSCKACKSECPANVDMARLKAEFSQHYHDNKGVPLSARLFGHYRQASIPASWMPRLANFVVTIAIVRWILHKFFNISPHRDLPKYAKHTFQYEFKRHQKSAKRALVSAQADANADDVPNKVVWLYVDPFSEFTEPEVGMAAVRVLEAAGYRVELLPVSDDGRTLLSKGLVRAARKLTEQNLRVLKPLFERYPERKIVGLEPSALLTFRDETRDLCDEQWRPVALECARRARLFEEFVAEQHEAGEFQDIWTSEPLKSVLLHGHCHQKALVGVEPTEVALGVAGYQVETLQTGCCGMAGSFGYEANHYDLSMQIGELTLFPLLRDADSDAAICASGTSCRHQIRDGVSRESQHAAVLLERALR